MAARSNCLRICKRGLEVSLVRQSTGLEICSWLADERAGSLVSRYDWRVRHAEVPDFARGELVDGGSEAGSKGSLMHEMERSGALGEERWSTSLDGIEEVDEDGRR